MNSVSFGFVIGSLLMLAASCTGTEPLSVGQRMDAGNDQQDNGEDAGTTNPGSDAGADGSDGGQPPGITCDNALFCEDFENLAIGPANSPNWTTDGPGTVTIDTLQARGTKALHVTANATGFGRMNVKLTAPNNSFFGRMWVYVEAFPSAPNYAHYTLVETIGPENVVARPIGGQFIQEAGNIAMWGPGSDKGPAGDFTRWHQDTPSVAAQWVCLEWEMFAPENRISIWVDGQAKPNSTVSTNDHPNAGNFTFPTMTDIWFGWWLYQGQTTPETYNVWIDDIVLATSKVGC